MSEVRVNMKAFKDKLEEYNKYKILSFKVSVELAKIEYEQENVDFYLLEKVNNEIEEEVFIEYDDETYCKSFERIQSYDYIKNVMMSFLKYKMERIKNDLILRIEKNF